MLYKTTICMLAGGIGAVIAQAFGGWSDALTVLLILMGIDYLSGLIVAGVFHRSPKSESGALESLAGLKGLVRKFFIVCIVVVAHLIDRLLGTDYLRDAAAIAFCLNEVISIIENAGLMGVPMPKVIMMAIDALRQKAGEDGKAESGQRAVERDADSRSLAEIPEPAPEVESDGWPVDELDPSAVPQDDMNESAGERADCPRYGRDDEEERVVDGKPVRYEDMRADCPRYGQGDGGAAE